MENERNGRNNGFQARVDEQLFTLPHPNPTGRELLELVHRAPAEFFLTLVLPGEPDRLVEPDETVDLSAPGTEQFSLVSKARYYSFNIDEKPFSIPNPTPTGRELLRMVGKTPETHLLNLNLPNQDDELIDADETIDLRKPGQEHFSVTIKNPLSIVIDEVTYHPTKKEMTGAELRNVANPPVPSDRDLWLDVPGKDDHKVQAAETVHLKDGMVFYTAPSTINPGGRP